jgi:hypothetical protein
LKVLFDHNLPHKLRTDRISRSNHEIITASYLGRGGMTNGELLRKAEQDGFEVFVTGDQRLISQQNLTRRRFAVIAPSSNNSPIIRIYLPAILAAIDRVALVPFRWSTAESLLARSLPASKPMVFPIRVKLDARRDSGGGAWRKGRYGNFRTPARALAPAPLAKEKSNNVATILAK